MWRNKDSMPIIYLTENLFNKALGIEPWQYVGSDQYDRPDYFGSSLDLKSDIARLGASQFKKTIIAQYFGITNKELRKLEAVELKKMNVKKDSSYYNKSDLYAPGGGVKGMKHKVKRVNSQSWKDSRTGAKWSDEQREKRCGEGNPVFGRKAPQEERDARSTMYTGEGNPNALSWEIHTPTGEVITTKGLRAYCRDNNLPFNKIYSSTGGWKSIKHGAGKGGGRKRKVNE